VGSVSTVIRKDTRNLIVKRERGIRGEKDISTTTTTIIKEVKTTVKETIETLHTTRETIKRLRAELS
jgi:septal ring factor EnvC (AmiA/AmiB activator)